MQRFIPALVIALVAAPVHGAPLVFGEIGGEESFASRSELAVCARAEGGFTCRLTRTSFGGLPLNNGRMTLDSWERVRFLRLELDREDYDRAYALLTGRYGKPATLQPQPEWTRFDEGGRIRLQRRSSDVLVTFDWPANSASAYDLRPSMIWTLLLFTVAGLATGTVLRRARRSASRSAQPVSMKQTLERRMREGSELHF